jgi:hypothetical protein
VSIQIDRLQPNGHVPVRDKMALTQALWGLEHHGIVNKGKLLCVYVGTYGPEPSNTGHIPTLFFNVSFLVNYLHYLFLLIWLF